MSGTLRWRLERLRGMTPAEVVYRLLRAIEARLERRLVARAVPAPDPACRGNPWIARDPKVNASAYAQAAERIAEGRLDVYALRALNLGFPPRWNRDPKSGIEAPPAYGKRLDTGDPDLVGDIRYLWQPNRHAHLVTLAQAHALTKKRLYLETLEEHLDSWFLACPQGIGPNWSSALEAGVRLVNWSMALLLVAVQFDVFRSKLPTFHQFFAAENWIWLAVAMGITKIIHEFGHGLSCKHFGGECHEMGLMFLVFTPCLYCNVSDSWMLPEGACRR